MIELKIKSSEKEEVIDITHDINRSIKNKFNGVCSIFLKHTTAAISVADLDPGTDLDMLDAFREIIPNLDYRHPHDPSHVGDHILSTLIGPSLMVPVRNGNLDLGKWQSVVMFEFDGPRERSIVLTLIEN